MNPDRNANLVGVSVHSNEPSRRLTANENDILSGASLRVKYGFFLFPRANACSVPATEAQEVRNERALAVYNRVQHKLTGAFLVLLSGNHIC